MRVPRMKSNGGVADSVSSRMLLAEIIPRSATTITRRILSRVRSRVIIAAKAFASAVLPGRMSQATGEPVRSTATPSTTCG